MKNNTINRIAVCIICGTTAVTLSAQQRTMSEAKEIAQKTLSHDNNAPSHKLKAVGGNLLELAIAQNTPVTSPSRKAPSFAVTDKQPFYVFNDESMTSFVIVAGDERMGDVLGYSTTSPFMVDNLPDGMAGLLQFYAETYAELSQTTPVYQNPRKSIEWTAVAPLVKTRWGQGSPYNNDCPVHQNKHSLVGCAATAMAQVMKHHQWPQKGRGSYSYTTASAKLSQSMDFSTATFNWANMKNSYDSNASAPDVALLSHACGVSIAMDYTYNSSFAYIVDIPYALIQYFGYSSDAVCYRKEFFNADEWASILQRELLEGRPIIFRGANSQDNGGHLFVVDGCNSSGYLHVNWGWYGSSDGYFKIGNFVVGSSVYSYGQFIVAKITPNDLGEPEDVFFAQKFQLQHLEYYTDVKLSSVYCYASSTCLKDLGITFKGTLGVGIYDTKGKSLGLVTGEQVSLSCTWGYSTFNLRFNDDDLHQPDGKYVLKPVVVNRESQLMSPIRTLNGETDSLFIDITDGKMELIPVGITSPKTVPSTADTHTYTLDGRRTTPSTRNGLFIRNGKKRLVKQRL